MHYRMIPQADEAAGSVLDAVLASLETDKQMEADRAKLERACCAPQKLVMPEGAPRSAPVGSLVES
jgi:ArsR family transcriptional regulator